MADRYTSGRSTPRPIRYNDRLWADFTRYAKRRKTPAAVLLRSLMIAHLDKHMPEKPPVQRIVRFDDHADDVCVEIDLG